MALDFYHKKLYNLKDFQNQKIGGGTLCKLAKMF